jgi:DNA-binding NtrC family response regulator
MSDEAGQAILIIDDEEVILDLFRNLLEPEGYKVLLAPNAREGVRMLEEHKPPVAIVDKNLPDQSALDLIAQQKKRHPGTEFIIITAYSTLESAVAAMKMGAYSYIAKPFNDLEDILERIRGALSVAGKRG